MTRKEALHILEYERDNNIFCSSLAMDMAIEALKAQDRPIICPRCGRTFAESEGRE